MARLARKDLADLRAVEEEESRVSMHGGGRFIGAGRRGSSDEDCGMCGGGMSGGLPLLNRVPQRITMPYRGEFYGTQIVPYAGANPRFGPVVPYVPGRPGPRPPSTALVPYVPPRGGPVRPVPVGPLVPVGPGGPVVAPPRGAPPKPPPISNIKPISNKPITINTPSGKPVTIPAKIPPKGPSRNALIAKLAAAGLAVGTIAAIIAGSLGAFGPVGSQDEEGDQGYYDDYTGEAGVDEGGPYAPGGDAGPGGPGGMYGDIYGPGGPGGLVPTNLSPSEVAFYLQSGNLPDRFYSGPRSKRGGARQPEFTRAARRVAMPVAQVGGGRRSGRRSDRAAIVKQVMADQGISMIEASRYVKANNLY